MNWNKNAKEIRDSGLGVFRNESFYFKKGVTWSGMSSSFVSFRFSDPGFVFDSNKGPMIFHESDDYDFPFLLGFLNTKPTNYILNVVNPTVSTQIGDIVNLPSPNKSLKERVSYLGISSINITKSDWDSRETSWDFKIHPLLNGSPNLKETYQAWEKGVTADFFQLHQNEEELNRIFIGIYGLEEELTPEVPLTEITILQEEIDDKKLERLEKEIGDKRLEIGFDTSQGIKLPIKRVVVMKQLISYAIGVNLGRYRLDKSGLNIAHPDPSEGEVACYSYNGYTVEIDEDGIIPLMGTACIFTDDAFQRVRYFLEIVWGEASLTQNLNFLQECLDEDLESYLLKKFWADHCKTYKKKPIYWLFSSEKGAFQVLTYMHRMNAFTVEKIRSNYLMAHLKHLRSQIDRLEATKEDPRLLDRLQKNLDECEAYDLLLKDTADKQITFDLDDGVSRNYELFEGVVRKVK